MIKPNNPLRVLSFGAGAIGTYIGGSLALKGHSVVFVERPEIVREIKNRGLKLEIANQIFHIPDPLLADSIDSALAYGPYDASIFALKSYDTNSAIETLRPFQTDLPPILCLQNGVENEKLLASNFGENKVIAGTVTSAIGRKAAGDIVLERLRGIGIASTHVLAPQLAQAMSDAGLKCHLYRNALSMKWSKLFTNLPANAASAILNLSPGDIFSNPKLYEVEMLQLREALAVMAAQNISVVDLPATPVKLFAFAVQNLRNSFSRPLLHRAIGAGRGTKMPSFHIDLYGGRGKSEVINLNGAVVDYGEQLGIKAPVNRFLTDTLMRLTTGDLPISEYTGKPEKYYQAIQKSILI